MKSNVRIIILALAVLTFLGWYQVLGVALENSSAQKTAMTKAEAQIQAGTYELAMASYEEAMTYGDTMELRRAMDELYHICLEEESAKYDSSRYERFLTATISAHPEDAEAYAISIRYWYEQGKYARCYELICQAGKKSVSSDELSNWMEQIRYQCKLKGIRYDGFVALSDGLMAVHTSDQWDYVDAEGNVILSGHFELAQAFDGNLTVVVKNGSVKLIDRNGIVQAVLPEETVSGAGAFGNGLAPVLTDSGYCYVDQTGTLSTQLYDYAGCYAGGVAAVQKAGIWAIIDTEGNTILDGLDNVKLDHLGYCSRADIIIASQNGVYGLYRTDGERIGTQTYEDADCFYEDGLAAVKSDGLWGYINKEGVQVLPPAYEQAKSFSNGLAGVSADGLWGFLDESGRIVIPCEYEDVDYWNEEGSCFVKTTGYWKILEKICK